VISQITESIAETEVEQTFLNLSSTEQEGTYLFPLPEGSTITSFSLKAGTQTLEGKLMTREEARGVYESIVRRRQDPALLEYIDRGLFRASVFPIPAHGERMLTVRYVQVIKPEGSARKFSYPLSTGRYSNRPIETMTVSVKLKTTTPLRTVYSPTHDVSVRRIDDHQATAAWEGKGEFPDRDFQLFYSMRSDDLGLSMLTQPTGEKSGHFLLVASPRVKPRSERTVPKQVVFVIDRTGSMKTDNKMEQARNALIHCLKNLNTGDRFNVISFNEGCDLLNRDMLPASPENIAKAVEFAKEIQASGGTNINEALMTGIRQFSDSAASRKMIVFLTDGLPTVGETNPERILENVRNANLLRKHPYGDRPVTRTGTAEKPLSEDKRWNGIRLFCFGVGYDVNVGLLDRLADENHADADYIRPSETVEGIVSAFFDKVRSPALTDVSLHAEGVEISDVYPRRIPDLFHGSQIVVTGSYRGSAPGSIKLSGFSGEAAQSFTLEKAFGENAVVSPVVSRIWATRKIGYLLDQVRLHKNQEVIDEIVRLSREYGILTPYTSYLADDRNLTSPALRASSEAPHVMLLRRGGAVDSSNEERAKSEIRKLAEAKDTTTEQYRSLNAKGYQGAGRAPAQNQAAGPAGAGALGGGGLSGGLGGAQLKELEKQRRSDLALDAVTASKPAFVRPEMSQTEGFRQMAANSSVQAVADRVFYRNGNIWVDNRVAENQAVTRIRALSDAHFQLIRRVPLLARFTAVGREVVVRLGRSAVLIGPEGRENLSQSELDALTARQ
jgi:Ca-activated chloride channel family protein